MPYDFNGTTNRVEYTATSAQEAVLDGGTDITFSFMVKVGTWNTPNWPLRIHTDQVNKYVVGLASSNEFSFAYTGTAATVTATTSGTTLSTGTWYNVQCFWDASAGTVKVRVDNANEATATDGDAIGTNASVTAATFHYAHDPGDLDYADIELAEIGMWDRDLLAAEKAALAAGLSPRAISNNLLYYDPCWIDQNDSNRFREWFGATRVTDSVSNVATRHPAITYNTGGSETIYKNFEGIRYVRHGSGRVYIAEVQSIIFDTRGAGSDRYFNNKHIIVFCANDYGGAGDVPSDVRLTTSLNAPRVGAALLHQDENAGQNAAFQIFHINASGLIGVDDDRLRITMPGNPVSNGMIGILVEASVAKGTPDKTIAVLNSGFTNSATAVTTLDHTFDNTGKNHTTTLVIDAMMQELDAGGSPTMTADDSQIKLAEEDQENIYIIAAGIKQVSSATTFTQSYTSTVSLAEAWQGGVVLHNIGVELQSISGIGHANGRHWACESILEPESNIISFTSPASTGTQNYAHGLSEAPTGGIVIALGEDDTGADGGMMCAMFTNSANSRVCVAACDDENFPTVTASRLIGEGTWTSGEFINVINGGSTSSAWIANIDSINGTNVRLDWTTTGGTGMTFYMLTWNRIECSIFSFTGNNSGSQSVAHNLGDTPVGIIGLGAGLATANSVSANFAYMLGFSDLSTNRGMSHFSANSTNNDGWVGKANQVFSAITAGGGWAARGTVTSANSTNFTVTWNTVTTATFAGMAIGPGDNNIVCEIEETAMPTTNSGTTDAIFADSNPRIEWALNLSPTRTSTSESVARTGERMLTSIYSTNGTEAACVGMWIDGGGGSWFCRANRDNSHLFIAVSSTGVIEDEMLPAAPPATQLNRITYQGTEASSAWYVSSFAVGAEWKERTCLSYNRSFNSGALTSEALVVFSLSGSSTNSGALTTAEVDPPFLANLVEVDFDSGVLSDRVIAHGLGAPPTGFIIFGAGTDDNSIFRYGLALGFADNDQTNHSAYVATNEEEGPTADNASGWGEGTHATSYVYRTINVTNSGWEGEYRVTAWDATNVTIDPIDDVGDNRKVGILFFRGCDVAVGQFTAAGTAGNENINHSLGTTPKAGIFMSTSSHTGGTQDTVEDDESINVAVVDQDLVNYSLGYYSKHGVNNDGWGGTFAGAYGQLTGVDTIVDEASVTAWTSTQFTWNVSDATGDANWDVVYMLLGGDTLAAEIVESTFATASTTKTIALTNDMNPKGYIAMSTFDDVATTTSSNIEQTDTQISYGLGSDFDSTPASTHFMCVAQNVDHDASSVDGRNVTYSTDTAILGTTTTDGTKGDEQLLISSEGAAELKINNNGSASTSQYFGVLVLGQNASSVTVEPQTVVGSSTNSGAVAAIEVQPTVSGTSTNSGTLADVEVQTTLTGASTNSGALTTLELGQEFQTVTGSSTNSGTVVLAEGHTLDGNDADNSGLIADVEVQIQFLSNESDNQGAIAAQITADKVTGDSTNAGALITQATETLTIAGASTNSGDLPDIEVQGTKSGTSANSGAITILVDSTQTKGDSPNTGQATIEAQPIFTGASSSGGSITTQTAFAALWSLDYLEVSTSLGFPSVFVEINDLVQPTGALPTGQMAERRLIDVPRISEINLDSGSGISGFQRLTLQIDNSDGILNSQDIRGYFIRVFFLAEDGTTSIEYKGKIVDWTRSHIVTINVEDVEVEAFSESLPKRTTNQIIEAEKLADGSFAAVAVADSLGNPVPVIFGRAIKIPAYFIKSDGATREYDYILGEGVGLNGNNWSEIFTAYRNEQALDDIQGTMVSAGSTNIVLESADRRPNDWYNYWWVEMLTGNAAGEITHVTDYGSDDNRCTVAAWGTTPTSGTYRLREFRFYDGSQTSPYNGIAFLRFKKLLGTTSRADDIWVDCNALQDEVNRVRAIESILTNPTWGLGLTVDSTSFGTAATDMNTINAFTCEGALLQEVGATDLLGRLLSYRNMTLHKAADNLTISLDEDKVASYTFGLGDDTGFNNIFNQSPALVYKHPDQRVKNLKVKYRKNNKESDLYLHEFSRAANAQGTNQDLPLPFIYDHTAADIALDYKRKRAVLASRELALDVGLDGHDVQRGKSALVVIPSLNINEDFEIVSSSITPAGNNSVALVPTNSAPYTFVPFENEGGTKPVDESFAIASDFSATPPDPVSSVIVTGVFTNVPSATTGQLEVSWTIPNDGNYSGAEVFSKLNGAPSTDYMSHGIGFEDLVISGLEPGERYDVLVVSLNENGKFKGLGTENSNNLVPGDTATPGTPSGLSYFGQAAGQMVWTYSQLSDVTIDYYEYQIDNASTFSTPLFTGTTNDSQIRWQGQNGGSLASGITRWARVRAVKIGGTVGSWTTGVSGTTDGIRSGDVENDQINSQHYANLSIDSVHIASGEIKEVNIGTAEITTAKIGLLQVTEIVLGNDAVTSIKRQGSVTATRTVNVSSVTDGTMVQLQPSSVSHTNDGPVLMAYKAIDDFHAVGNPPGNQKVSFVPYMVTNTSGSGSINLEVNFTNIASAQPFGSSHGRPISVDFTFYFW